MAIKKGTEEWNELIARPEKENGFIKSVYEFQ